MKTSVLVIGLGRFGAAAARELMALGHEVLAVDSSETVVNEIAPDVTHAVQLDAADEAALRAIGAADFEHAIVAISDGVEASVFAVMALKQLGVGNVIAKAGSDAPRRDPGAGRGGPRRVRGARDGPADRALVRDARHRGLPGHRAAVRDRAGAADRALGGPRAERARRRASLPWRCGVATRSP